ncbi:MAG: proton-conducting transporter membrane subunit [Pirellulaceae bacterium]
MNDLPPILILLPPLLLAGIGIFLTRHLCPSATIVRRVVTVIAGLQLILATILLLGHLSGGLAKFAPAFASSTQGQSILNVYYDGVAGLMLVLVSFVGWVICRYSIRYLDGEASQADYFRWIALTIGAVSLMVVSGNLLMFFIAWVTTSMGLHRLLLHYGHRPAARRAAWTKFCISRLGDAALLAAMALIYSEFKTLNFAGLFAAIHADNFVSTSPMHVAGFLLVVAAITKSAQFPFHTWLPLTMETPTPVSALMHAGIVNAGGYLIIRLSPVMALTPSALTTLAIVGGLTACFAAVVMLTQTSIKKSLAYSTIAQMGFMMLQCGLGAYSAAMLHILAHSLYKAHAFLSSGSVMTQRAATGTLIDRKSFPVATSRLAAASVLGFIVLTGMLFLFGVDPSVKPGGILLGGVLWLALTHWIAQAMATGSRRLLLQTLCVSLALCSAYVVSFIAVDRWIAGSLPRTSTQVAGTSVAAMVLIGFTAMFALHIRLHAARRPQWFDALYVHASNGFYMENVLRRVFGSLSRV